MQTALISGAAARTRSLVLSRNACEKSMRFPQPRNNRQNSTHLQCCGYCFVLRVHKDGDTIVRNTYAEDSRDREETSFQGLIEKWRGLRRGGSRGSR